MPFLCIQNPLQCYSFWGFLMCLIVFLVGGEGEGSSVFTSLLGFTHPFGATRTIQCSPKEIGIQYRTPLDSWECIPVPARKIKCFKTFAIPDRTKVTLSWHTASFGPRNHEKWRLFALKIGVRSPKHEGCGFLSLLRISHYLCKWPWNFTTFTPRNEVNQ